MNKISREDFEKSLKCYFHDGTIDARLKLIIYHAYTPKPNRTARIREALYWPLRIMSKTSCSPTVGFGLFEISFVLTSLALAVILCEQMRLGGRFCALGIGLFFALEIIIIDFAIHLQRKKTIRTERSMCRSCGYDLSKLPSEGEVIIEGDVFDLGPKICPECAASWPRILPE